MKTPLHKLERKLLLGAYPRVSTDNQKEEQTIETQDDQMVEFLKNNDDYFELVPMQPGATLLEPKRAFFRDDPYNLEEWREDTALAELFRRIKQGKINAVLIAKRDRLFRSQNKITRAFVEDFLDRHLVRVFSVVEGELEEGFIRDIHSALGAEDKKSTVRRLHAAKKSYCRRDGRPPNGKTPYGYAWNSLEHSKKWSAEKEEISMCDRTKEALPIFFELAAQYPGTPEFESSLLVVCGKLENRAKELIQKDPSDPDIQQIHDLLVSRTQVSYWLKHFGDLR
jgi:DNA invertase Pin-like site-specific DNA recombinase